MFDFFPLHQRPNNGLVCLPFEKKQPMISPGLFFSHFSCYETPRLKPRLPRFITGGTKAKAVDKVGQTNSNQLPLYTHITPLSALLTYTWAIQDLSFSPSFTCPGDRWRKGSRSAARGQQVGIWHIHRPLKVSYILNEALFSNGIWAKRYSCKRLVIEYAYSKFCGVATNSFFFF